MRARGVDEPAGSWLCPTEHDCQRVMDMERRLQPVRAITFLVLAVALVISGPWLGWWTLAPLAVVALAFAVIDRNLERVRKPEYAIGLAWLLSQGAIASAVVLTGGPDSPAVAWLVIPAVTLPARFGDRGVVVGIGFTALLIVAVTLGADPAAVAESPPKLLFPLALLGGVTMLTLALRSSDLHHRGEAAIDSLTGMLNRKAFNRRMDELVQQSRVTGAPVGLVIADIDRFKGINDEYGHARGDDVLTDFAYRLRKQLRAFDLAYRLGGEEFAVLLPGASADEAAAVAERLRGAVEEEPIAGLDLTSSFGAASSGGQSLEPEVLFEAADVALYAAKEQGRNRVCQSGGRRDGAATGATWLARPSQTSNEALVADPRR